MTKHNLGDLNDHLFEQISRLSDGDLTDGDLDREVRRAKAMVAVSDQIVGNANLRLEAAKLYAQYGDGVLPHLPLVGGDGNAKGS